MEHPANRGHRVPVLCRVVLHELHRRLFSRPQTAKFLGHPMVLPPCGTESRLLSETWDGLYDYDCMRLFQQVVSPADTILDIGANVGCYTVLFASLASQGHVYAFEPNPEMCWFLTENITRNRFSERVCIIGKALGQERGVVDLCVNRNYPGNSRIGRVGVRQERCEVTSVQCVVLDEIVDDLGIHKCDYIKLDVEGYEEQVLLGGRQFLRETLPKAILFEANGLARDYGSDLSGLFGLFRENGYRLGMYFHDRGQVMLLRGEPQVISPWKDYFAFSSGFIDRLSQKCPSIRVCEEC